MAVTRSRMACRRSLVLALLLAVVLVAGPLAEVADARPRRRATSGRRAKKRPARLRTARGPGPCKWRGGGSVHPLCNRRGGGIRLVVVTNVPGTNMSVNQAWAPNVTSFVQAARAAGFDLQAHDGAGPGQGSFRTAAMQRELRRRGYPANRPGTSMHEWGLAVDLLCNGKLFIDDPSNHWCREWVRANAHNFGIYVHPGEPWHWSSNGR